jgi:hypothetical protein
LTEVFRGFPQSLQANVGILKLGHYRFLPNPFQFTIHLSPFHSTLYNLKKRRQINYNQTSKTMDKVQEVRYIIGESFSVTRPSTTNLTGSHPVLNPGHHGKMPAFNPLVNTTVIVL